LRWCGKKKVCENLHIFFLKCFTFLCVYFLGLVVYFALCISVVYSYDAVHFASIAFLELHKALNFIRRYLYFSTKMYSSLRPTENFPHFQLQKLLSIKVNSTRIQNAFRVLRLYKNYFY